MDKILEKQLAEVFEQDYQGYEYFVENVINKVFIGDDTYEALPVPENILDDTNRKVANNAGILQILKIGSIDAIEGIDVYDITLRDNKQLQYNRVGIQQLIRSQQIFYSNAFLLFHNEHPEEKEWRFSFFYKQGKSKDTTSAKRFTYLFGKNYRARTASERFTQLAEREKDTDNLLDAFSVEALSKEFFDKYREHYADIVEYITGKRYVKEKGKWVEKTIHEPCHEIFDQFAVSFTNPEKTVRDYIKKLLGRLVFLQFLQKKGWMGVPVDRTDWTGGDTRFLQNKFNEFEDKDNFIDGFLEPLFNDLNTNRQNLGNRASKAVGVDIKIPFLNGGLFQLDEEDCTNVRLPQHLLGDVIDFFEQYNFTIDENDPNDAQIGVDPEMLGRVFENLLEDNKDKGAFYTPKEIVQYMCQESLIAYLQTGIDNENVKESIRQFVLTHEVDYLGSMAEDINIKLLNVKICDPAIGSGAFPMGLLRQLYLCQCAIHPELEERNSADIKRHIIQNNIYGVDIEKGAVDIARLRFWLSLIVDEETPRFLPNLDFKIMQGNSLLEQYKGVDLSKMTELKKEKLEGTQLSMFEDMLDVLRLDLRKKLNEYYDCSDHHRKEHLKQEIIDNVKQQLREQSIYVDFGDLDLSANDQFTLWHTWFYDVFSQGGFDIVIGNPPYVQLQNNRGQLANLYKDCNYLSYAKTGDIYCLFYELGNQLLKRRGISCYITSNKWMRTAYGEKLRNYLGSNTNPLILIDFAGVKVFDNATVDTNILLSQRSKNEGKTISCIATTLTKDELSHLNDYIRKESYISKYDMGNSWIILTPTESRIKAKIENNRITLGSSDIVLSRGVGTGFDDAYCLCDEERVQLLTRCKTLEERERTSKIIHPLLRGRDIKRYAYDWKKMWMIYIPLHFPLEEDDSIKGVSKEAEQLFQKDYPTVYSHLLRYKDKLSARDKTETGIRYEWYCLQRPRYDKFKKLGFQKIIYQELSQGSPFTVDEDGLFLLTNSAYFIVSDNCLFLTGILNSSLIEYSFSKFYCTKLGSSGVRWLAQNIVHIPIPSATEEQKKCINSLVEKVLHAKRSKQSADIVVLESQIDFLVYHLYGLTYDEVLIVDPETPITREEYESRQ